MTLVAVAAILAFAWPAARIAPRDLPVGIVGVDAAGQHIATGLDKAAPDGFDLHVYASEPAARRAIEHRDIYGAFVPQPGSLTVLTASAGSPTVAQLLTSAGQQLAGHSASATGTHSRVHVVDVVPTSAADPRGTVFNSALLPLTICGIALAGMVCVLLRIRTAGLQVGMLAVTSAAVGIGVYLVTQSFLGALPHEHVATWAALALTVFAIGTATAGLVALLGPSGLGVAAALMMFVGNGFSGVTSAPQLLPGAVNHLGQWLPPGAGANLLRSVAYFGGHGAAGHLAVLVTWSLVGVAAVGIGHRRRATTGGEPAHGAHELSASDRSALDGRSASPVAVSG